MKRWKRRFQDGIEHIYLMFFPGFQFFNLFWGCYNLEFQEPASLAPIKTTHLRPDACIPIFMILHVQKQAFRLGLGDLGLGGTWGQGDRV
jgi:hypothetical protein